MKQLDEEDTRRRSLKSSFLSLTLAFVMISWFFYSFLLRSIYAGIEYDLISDKKPEWKLFERLVSSKRFQCI